MLMLTAWAYLNLITFVLVGLCGLLNRRKPQNDVEIAALRAKIQTLSAEFQELKQNHSAEIANLQSCIVNLQKEAKEKEKNIEQTEEEIISQSAAVAIRNVDQPLAAIQNHDDQFIDKKEDSEITVVTRQEELIKQDEKILQKLLLEDNNSSNNDSFAEEQSKEKKELNSSSRDDAEEQTEEKNKLDSSNKDDEEEQSHQQQLEQEEKEKEKESEKEAERARLEELRIERMKQEEYARKCKREAEIEAKGLIRAFCRVRPPTKKNVGKASVLEVPVDISDSLTLVDVEGGNRRTKDYQFDHVFPPSASQEEVFCQVQELVESALDGNQVCVMAYGQTGSGKSFTMEGSEEHPGLIPRAAVQIFQEISSSRAHNGWTFNVQVSAIEIYNNKIREVLVPEGKNPVERKIFTANRKTGSIVIRDLTIVEISTPEEILCCFERAMENRCTRSTTMNAKSSRSHFVFQIDLCGQRDQEQSLGKLIFMDLAGSEALDAAHGKDSAIKQNEGKSIRESLTTLKSFLIKNAKGMPDSGCRTSVIARLMKEYLRQPKAKLLVIANVSPYAESLRQTKEALDFLEEVSRINTIQKPRERTILRKFKAQNQS